MRCGAVLRDETCEWEIIKKKKNLGLKTGDKILSVDGEKVKKFRSLPLEFINGNNYQIERNGAVLDQEIPEDFISQLMDRGKSAGNFLNVRYPFVIANVQKDSLNGGADIQPKDIVTAINGNAISYYDEASS